MNDLSLTCEVRATYHYRTYPPAGGETPGLPLVFFFHGRGERGADLRLVEKHGPSKLAAAGKKFPFLLVCPQCPETEYWTEAPALAEFVAAAIIRHHADPTRIYLTGLSMGGFAVWALAHRHPERYAAILPVCGGGDPRWAPRLKDIPIWAFHGAKDTVVPPERTTKMIDAIRAAGGSPRLTVYPEAKHDSWTETYENPAVYDWLLSHSRQTS